MGATTEAVRATDALHGSRILAAIKNSGIEFVLSVPDTASSAPLLQPIAQDRQLRLVRVCKEDECVGIAAGLAFCSKRAMT
jgi:sulfopyruvate decarboxylase subunit alpha